MACRYVRPGWAPLIDFGLTCCVFVCVGVCVCVVCVTWCDGQGYEPRYWYFEVVSLLLKLLLSAVTVLFLPKSVAQVMHGSVLAAYGCLLGGEWGLMDAEVGWRVGVALRRNGQRFVFCRPQLFVVAATPVCLPGVSATGAAVCMACSWHLA